MLREALLVLSVALSTTVLLIAVRGLPALARPTAESATCSGPVAEHPAVQWISPDAAEILLRRPDVAIVDTRGKADYEAGHIPSALHISMDTGTLDPRALSSVQGFATIIAYCDARGQCARSTRFAALLSASGFRDVRVLEGGISAWLEGGRAAESGECRQCE
jgi:hydroxyacylglutathione hydrolase